MPGGLFYLPPVPRFDETGESDRLPALVEAVRSRSPETDEAKVLADALRVRELWLEWAGKREKR